MTASLINLYFSPKFPAFTCEGGAQVLESEYVQICNVTLLLNSQKTLSCVHILLIISETP